MKNAGRNEKSKGFTIVELMTVMGVIAILIGLLVPALDQVRRIAKEIRQKAQFHSIDIALEMYKNEEGDYPESSLMPNTLTGSLTCGAQRLAEALVGRDLQGFDPMSTWDAQADETTNNTVIYANPNKSVQTEIDACDARRKGPYLKLDNVGAFNIAQLYKTNTGSVYAGSNLFYPAPVLTDVFVAQNIALSTGKTVKAGSPILYYKADPSKKEHVASSLFINPNIYSNFDNDPILELGKMTKQAELHPIYNPSGLQDKFYAATENPYITTVRKPYNSDSFLLLSAGYDGLYGTADDIWNFGE